VLSCDECVGLGGWGDGGLYESRKSRYGGEVGLWRSGVGVNDVGDGRGCNCELGSVSVMGSGGVGGDGGSCMKVGVG